MLWKEVNKDGYYCKWAEILADTAEVDFGISASYLVCKLKDVQSCVSFFFPLSQLDEDFLLMVGTGFFVETGNRYQMSIPSRLDLWTVKEAALWITQAADDNWDLHPERIIKSLPIIEAKSWQERLSQMDQNLRLADRQVLMGGAGLLGGPDCILRL
jgi:hypothetical protein